MSFAQIVFGQNSFNLAVGSHLIDGKNYNFRNSKPSQIGFGYAFSKSIVGFDISANYLSNTIDRVQPLSVLVENSTFSDNRNTNINTSFVGAGLGPNFNLEVSEFFMLKISTTFNVGNMRSNASYSDKRSYVRPIQGDKFETVSEVTITSQQRKSDSLSSFIKVGIGSSFFENLPVGIEFGWMNLNYGKTINNLNPDGIYADKTIQTRTNLYYFTSFLNLRKKDK